MTLEELQDRLTALESGRYFDPALQELLQVLRAVAASG